MDAFVTRSCGSKESGKEEIVDLTSESEEEKKEVEEKRVKRRKRNWDGIKNDTKKKRGSGLTAEEMQYESDRHLGVLNGLLMRWDEELSDVKKMSEDLIRVGKEENAKLYLEAVDRLMHEFRSVIKGI